MGYQKQAWARIGRCDGTNTSGIDESDGSRERDRWALALPFHCDGSDLVGLMCLENGRSGGYCPGRGQLWYASTTSWCGSVRTAAALYDELPYDFRGEQASGGKPYYLVPVFTQWENRLFVLLHPACHFILASQRAPRNTSTYRASARSVAGRGRGGGRSDQSRPHGVAAGRHAIHQQLPRAPRCERPTRMTGRRARSGT